MKQFERRAVEALKALLTEIPTVKVSRTNLEHRSADRGIDLVLEANVSGRPYVLVCEIKSSGQPRHVHAALLQLRNDAAHRSRPAIPVLIAPYLSPEARALCRQNEIGFVDLEGNAHLVFDGVFIDRSVSTRPPAERRELGSLFKAKSSRILRVLFSNPKRAWRVVELAKKADVSLGHVSNVRTNLIKRGWAAESKIGLALSDPDALLDSWRDSYRPQIAQRLGFYTASHGKPFEEMARATLGEQAKDKTMAFASFSAAQWMAPYARTGTNYFYAHHSAIGRLERKLKLSSVSKGENVVVMIPKDEGLFRDVVEPARGAVCTSPVQTYLDLTQAGERGVEAADHLRSKDLTWK